MRNNEDMLGLVDKFPECRILVVGDVMLDRYVAGSVDRISPEAPVPVVVVRREHATLGGAGNVALNIATLSGRAVMAGFVGDDAAAGEVRDIMTTHGIGMETLCADATLRTTVKMRVLAERQQVVRIDYEAPSELPADVEARFCRQLADTIPTVDGVIIEDYGKGAISQTVVDTILDCAAQHDVFVGLDPKDNHELQFSRLRLATPNYAEACGAAGMPPLPLDDSDVARAHLKRVGETLSALWHTDTLIITLGPHGMYVIPREGSHELIPTQAREVFDVSGAGDTVIATAMLALAAGGDAPAAARLANHAAGIVVAKLGTRPCMIDELRAGLQDEQAR